MEGEEEVPGGVEAILIALGTSEDGASQWLVNKGQREQRQGRFPAELGGSEKD